MRMTGRSVLTCGAGTLTVRNTCALVVALVVILGCSACSDGPSYHATPEDVVGDWHVVEDLTTDTCSDEAGSHQEFDARLTAAGNTISLIWELTCQVFEFSPLVSNKIVMEEHFTDTLTDCVVTRDYRTEATFTSNNHFIFTDTYTRTVSGSACAGLGQTACKRVYKGPAERCDGCFGCVTALSAPPADATKGAGRPFGRLFQTTAASN
jgi:hypothetical protein